MSKSSGKQGHNSGKMACLWSLAVTVTTAAYVVNLSWKQVISGQSTSRNRLSWTGALYTNIGSIFTSN